MLSYSAKTGPLKMLVLFEIFLYKSKVFAEIFPPLMKITILRTKYNLFHSFCSLFCSYCGEFT